MKDVYISDYKEEIIFHFGHPTKHSINAYSLASSLVHIADAIKEANSVINPGYEIEIVVTAFAPGSFKICVRAVYKSLQNILSSHNLKDIVLGVIASCIFQYTLAPEAVKIVINTNEVAIESDGKTIIVPREVYEASKQVERSERFIGSISKIFSEVGKDPNITSFGVTSSLDDTVPDIEIPREKLVILANHLEPSEGKRQIREITELKIRKAILDRSKRKWEFVWRGVTINAPILDDRFYDKFIAHDIKIAPGDVLEAELLIHQEQDPSTGIYVNKKYEIVNVRKHIPRLFQGRMHAD